jgi:hypothetical protein
MKCYLFTLVCFFCTPLFCQTITGNVTDESGKAVAYATVRLLKAKDSSLFKLTVTDTLGKYAFEKVPASAYFLTISEEGFNDKIIPTFSIVQNTKKSFPTVVLQKVSGSLANVTVTTITKKPAVQVLPDKMVFNVAGSITSSGDNVMELLQKLPGISVDQNGNLTLNGKSGVMVMINGRKTYLNGDQLKALLSSMSANNVDNVEITDIGSAKYEASSSAGIINININKPMKKGFNGELNAGYGQDKYPKPEAGISLNYRNSHFNVYGSYHYTHHINWHNLDFPTEFYDPANDKQLLFTSERIWTHKHPQQDHNFTAGIEYTIDKNNSLNLNVNGVFSSNHGYVIGNVVNKDPQKTVTSFYNWEEYDTGHYSNTTYTLSYQRTLDTSGSKISAEADYAYIPGFTNSIYNTYYYDSAGNLTGNIIQEQTLPTTISIKSFQMDYSHPIKKSKTTLEAGWKIDEVITKNQAEVSDYNSGHWKPNTHYSDDFSYTEKVLAGYFNYTKNFKKLSVVAGLRAEQTITNAQQLQIDSVNKRSYAQLFPSFSFSRPLNDKNTISLSYGRKIDRPDYNQLNPFHTFGDTTSYWTGNPYLKPQLSNNVELTYSYKGKLITSFLYMHVKDVQVVTLQVRPGNISAYGFDNLGTENHYELKQTFILSPLKWWSFNLFILGFYQQYKGIYLGSYVNNGFATANANISNQFKFKHGFSAELGGYYYTRFVYSVFTGYPWSSFYAGVQKSLFKGQGTIKLGAEDMFKTAKLHFDSWSNHSYHEGFIYPWYGVVQNIHLNFTWRFGNLNNNQAQHVSGIQKEVNRAGK